MPIYRLTLEYDGTDFEGWQVQARGHRTVQGALEHALARVVGQRVVVTGAGRTDAGVHAQGQVASIALEGAVEAAALSHSLNAVLPPDLAVVALARAADGFHARRDARGKLYRYSLWTGSAPSPLRARRSHRVHPPLDPAAMRRAAFDLVGSHDFASFQTSGSPTTTSARTLRRLDIEGQPGDEVHLWFEGDGFLRHMVRNIAGTLLEVSRGKRDPASMPALLGARDRSLAGPTAPARGLTLVQVFY